MNPMIKKIMYIAGGCAVLVAGAFIATTANTDALDNITDVFNPSGDLVADNGVAGLNKPTTSNLNEVVSVSDLILKQAINVSLDRPSDADITVGDMQSLKSLTCTDCGLSDLTGLEYATNLVQLDLHENYISDLTPLNGLTKLETVCLGDNRIADLSPLESLTNVKSLEVSYNKIADLTPLSNLTNLETMNATNNVIEDIAVLANLTNLKTLDLSANSVQNIEALATLDTLQRANLEKNPIEDVTAVMNLYGTEDIAVMKGASEGESDEVTHVDAKENKLVSTEDEDTTSEQPKDETEATDTPEETK